MRLPVSLPTSTKWRQHCSHRASGATLPYPLDCSTRAVARLRRLVDDVRRRLCPSSRGEAIAERAAEAATRHGWEAKVERAETQLATLGKYRPTNVIRTELAAAAVPQHIWRRSRQCHDLTLEEVRLACAPVLGLRRELAAAEAAERLEAQLVAGRAQLATVAVPGSVADPQASALAWLTGVDEGAVRTGIALLLAGLIEVGSALGFTLVSMATARNPQPPSSTPSHTPGSPDTAPTCTCPARGHAQRARSPGSNPAQRS